MYNIRGSAYLMYKSESTVLQSYPTESFFVLQYLCSFVSIFVFLVYNFMLYKLFFKIKKKRVQVKLSIVVLSIIRKTLDSVNK